MNHQNAVGFYGKLPARGDFVSMNLAPSFVRQWDSWLQQSVYGSQVLLGNAWLDRYLNMPLWRFALSPGACGSLGHMGVLMASVDKVGRYFPFVVACPVPPGLAIFPWAMSNSAWFNEIEQLTLGALSFTLDMELFRTRIAASAELLKMEPDGKANEYRKTAQSACQAVTWEHNALRYAHRVMSCDSRAGLAVFWVTNAGALSPRLLYSTGMPAEVAYATMLSSD